VPHPRRVDREAPGLGILAEGVVEPGSVASAWSMIGFKLSGMATLNTPPKNTHAASNPAITSDNVWPWVG
jgi:hypothetical protein